MRVAAILPVRGRFDQTITTAQRLRTTAGWPEVDWIAVGGTDEGDTLQTLRAHGWRIVGTGAPRLTYWQALAAATRETDAQLLCTLASDLLPGMHWLARGVAAYREAFPGEHDYGLLGFNGDSHGIGHSCHFLIDRDLLTYLGGWPTWYDHNFGDTELCQRTQALGLYAKAPWALLFHDHVYFGGEDDEVYAEGRKLSARDGALFNQRRAAGWPTVQG